MQTQLGHITASRIARQTTQTDDSPIKASFSERTLGRVLDATLADYFSAIADAAQLVTRVLS